MRNAIGVDGRGHRRVGSFLVAGLCCLWAATTAIPAAADVAAGREAFEKGDYQRAVLEWQNAADRGDADAQFGMGSLYERGAGALKQDYKRADYWYRKAAEQGNTEAQYRLALVWSAGGDGFPPDLIEAYKWTVLAAESKGVWGSAAAELKTQLDKVTSPHERDQGKERATAWQQARQSKEEAVAALPAPSAANPPPSAANPPPSATSAPPVTAHPIANPEPPAPLTKSTGGCPGWPFPTLPCTEQFPALPGGQGRSPAPAPPPAPAVAGAPASTQAIPAPRPSAAKAPLEELNQALKQIDCASLNARTAEGAAVISGTVPNEDQRAKLMQVAARLFPDNRPEINVEIVPPPLCQALAELHGMRLAGLITESGLTVRLTNGGNRLRQGDLIELSIQAPNRAVHLQIDYFSLDGQVLHLAPSLELPSVQLAAGTAGVFGHNGRGRDWIAGGAPFGTELIAVTATSAPLNFGTNRPPTEKAVDYLRELRRALGREPAGTSAMTLLLVHTSAR
ncbi:MAG: SEL1-like repeat protein [Alphaproteobacteria bacterium]|nr:SEL1-like repeat protein [Alphaproteobacteria bacterium]